MAKRADPHSHANLDPADYRFATAFEAWHTEPGLYIGESGYYRVYNNATDEASERWGCNWLQAQDRFAKELLRDHGVEGGHWAESNRCDCCGAGPIREVTVMQHVPTGRYIAVGGQCQRRFDCADRRDYLNRYSWEGQLASGKAMAREWVAEISDWLEGEHDGATAIFMERITEHARQGMPERHPIVVDMIGKLVRYGSLSEKQVALLVRLETEPEPEPEAEPEPTKEAPAGKIRFEGEVLGEKEHANEFGITTKWLCRATDGAWKLWVTKPRAAFDLGLGRGSRVSFNVSVEPSRDDPFFAFGKRPTKLEAA